MGKRTDRNIIVGLDIGTSKVIALVGELKADESIEVIGIGSAPSRGLKHGVVVNIDSTVQSIQRAIEQAELMAGVNIHSVYTGIAGSHIRSLNSHGIVAIKDKEIQQGDVQRVIDAAKDKGFAVMGNFDMEVARGGHEGPLDFPNNDSRFHNYDETMSLLNDLNAQYGDITRLHVIGKSVEGRNLRLHFSRVIVHYGRALCADMCQKLSQAHPGQFGCVS